MCTIVFNCNNVVADIANKKAKCAKNVVLVIKYFMM